jgi:tetratricopeptide (TPR) repeat protein
MYRFLAVAMFIAMLSSSKAGAQNVNKVYVLDPTELDVKEGKKSEGCFDVHPFTIVGNEGDKLIVRDFEVKAAISKKNTIAAERAYEHFSNALKMNPRDFQALQFRAAIALHSGKPQMALGDLNELIRVHKSSCQAHVKRGTAWQELGNHEKALADFKKAVELNPKSGIAHNSLAWELATCPDARIRDGQRAIESAKKAAEEFKSAPCYVIDTLAAAFAEAGDFDEATKHERRAIEMLPAEFPSVAKEMEHRMKMFE